MMFKYLITTLLSSLFFISSSLIAMTFPQSGLVNVAVADLRSAPLLDGVDPSSSVLLSQGLYGESLVIQEQQDSWYRVEIMEQSIYDANTGWIPLAAWIRQEQVLPTDESPMPNLVVNVSHARIFSTSDDASADSSFTINTSMGSELYGVEKTFGIWKIRLVNGESGYIRNGNVSSIASLADMDSQLLRKSIVDTAKKWVNEPFLAGGRSAYDSASGGQPTGVDNAGLINLIFRANGMHLPRTAGDLYMGCSKLANNPQKGDLVFLADHMDPTHITHVMLVMNHDKLLEITKETQSVRTIKAKNRLGAPLSTWNSMDDNGQYVIYFGTFLTH